MLKQLIRWAFKDELSLIAKETAKHAKISAIKSVDKRKQRRSIFTPHYYAVAALEIGEVYTIERPKVVLGWGNKSYSVDYCGYANRAFPPRKHSQKTINGKCVIKRVK